MWQTLTRSRHVHCPLSRAILSRGSRHWNEIINVVLAGEPDNHGPVTCNWPIVWVQVSVLDNVTMLCLLRTLNNVLCLETAVPAYTPHPHCIHYMLRLRLKKRTKKKSSQFSSCFYVLSARCECDGPGCVVQGEDGDVLQNVNTAIAPITFLVTTATAQLLTIARIGSDRSAAAARKRRIDIAHREIVETYWD